MSNWLNRWLISASHDCISCRSDVFEGECDTKCRLFLLQVRWSPLQVVWVDLSMSKWLSVLWVLNYLRRWWFLWKISIHSPQRYDSLHFWLRSLLLWQCFFFIRMPFRILRCLFLDIIQNVIQKCLRTHASIIIDFIINTMVAFLVSISAFSFACFI